MPQPTARSYAGVAKETAHAIGAAPTAVAATDFIPIRTATPFDNVKYLDDTGWRGSMVDAYNIVQSVAFGEFAYTGDWFPDTAGYPLMGLLGDYAITGSSTPYTHTGAVLNTGTGQATSFSYTDYYGMAGGSSARQFAGCQVSDVNVKFVADGMMEYDAKVGGFQSALVTNPAPNFSQLPPLPAWVGNFSFGSGAAVQVTNKAQTTTVATLTTAAVHGLPVGVNVTVYGLGLPFDGTFVTIAGTTASTITYTVPTGTVASTPVTPNGYAAATYGYLQSGALNIKRTVTPIFTVQGTQRPYQVFQGPLQVDGTILVVAEDDTQLNLYLQNTQPQLDLCFQYGSGASLVASQFHMSKVGYRDSKITRGKDFIENAIAFKAYGNSYDVGASGGQGLIKASLRNSKSTAVFA